MTLRVPTSTTYSRLERGLAVSLTRVQQLQGELSGGSKITKFSDDAVGAAAGLRIRAEEADIAAYGRSGDDAQAALGMTDTALQSALDLLSMARQLSISGSNGALDPSARAALGEQIANVRNELADVANTQHLGRAVFGGHKATAVGAPPTYAYTGDSGIVSRQLSPSLTMPINLDGQDVFGFSGGGPDVFQVLTQLEQSVRSGDKAGNASGQAALATRTDAVTTALGQVGAMVNRVTVATDVGVTVLDRLTDQRSQIEDVDLAATILRLQAAQNGYTAALGAVAKANLPSLANFLS
jgi:flagellar hook-associated protein 3 FlgL